MSILFNKKKNEAIINCDCGCDDSVHIRFDDCFKPDICWITYLLGQSPSLKYRLRKAWRAFRGKPNLDMEIIMTQADFMEFADFIEEQRKTIVDKR